MLNHQEIERVRAELKKAGMTAYGFMKLETDYLPSVIHENEHIEGVVYGRMEGVLDSVMLVATNKRVIFIDCKPFYKNWDEITYEVVAGVRLSIVGPFAGVVLHTRVKDYSLRFVNIKCAHIFVEYIESYIEKIEAGGKQETKNKVITKSQFQPYRIESNTIEDSIKDHREIKYIDDTLILSTTDRYGNPHASVMHFEVDKNENFYILTKSNSKKAKNIIHNNNVFITIHPSHSMKVFSIKGKAIQVKKPSMFNSVYEELSKIRKYAEGTKLPPIDQIEGGEYIIFKISASNKELKDYSTSDW